MFEISNKHMARISPKYWKIKQHLLHNPMIEEKITTEIIKWFDLTKNENTCQNM